VCLLAGLIIAKLYVDVGVYLELPEHIDQLVDEKKTVAVWPRLAIDDQQRPSSWPATVHPDQCPRVSSIETRGEPQAACRQWRAACGVPLATSLRYAV
jgi:hypothetical protein